MELACDMPLQVVISYTFSMKNNYLGKNWEIFVFIFQEIRL